MTALTDTECIVTTYDELMGSLQEMPEWVIGFMRTFVRRRRHMNDLMTRIRPARHTEAECRQCVEEAMAVFRLRE